MSLFAGVENFTPAFTGQQIANQTGSGAASAFTGGFNAGSNKQQGDQQIGLAQDKFSYQKSERERQIKMLEEHMAELRRLLGGSGLSGGYGYGQSGGSD